MRDEARRLKATGSKGAAAAGWRPDTFGQKAGAPTMLPRVAALFVERDGPYATAENVDVWDMARDARRYAGPHPVVAHPPCTRWCRLAGLVEHRWGHRKGEDEGCFAAALAAVRRWGGVLEHPAFSDAWSAFGLFRPLTGAGWQRADWQGGWSCYVEQRFYGHHARKATWLYASHVELPSLRWGLTPTGAAAALVSWSTIRTRDDDARPRLGKRAASETPVEFRDALLSIARSVNHAIADETLRSVLGAR